MTKENEKKTLYAEAEATFLIAEFDKIKAELLFWKRFTEELENEQNQ